MRRALVFLPLLVLPVAMTGCAGPETGFELSPDGTCDPAQLRPVVSTREDSDPQLVVVDVALTNRGEQCLLDGFPTVSVLSLDPTIPIGESASSWGAPPEPVTLPWKSTAYVLVQARKSLDDTECAGELASGMSLVLPGRDEPLVSSAPVAKYCAFAGSLLTSAVTSAPLVVDGFSDYVEPY